MSDFLRYEKKGSIVSLAMDAPEVRNAISGEEAVGDFVRAAAKINADPEVKVVILTSDGPAFSAGGDLAQMSKLFDEDPHALRQWYRDGIQKLVQSVYSIEIPVIAAVNGPAVGAGLDLCCLCDVRIASQRAQFAESFINVGLIPGDGGAWLLQRLVGKTAAYEMTFTGRVIDAEEALHIGLVSRVVGHEDLRNEAMDTAEQIARGSGRVLRGTKRLLRAAEKMDFSSLLEMSAVIQSGLHGEKFHRDAVSRFLERKKRKN